MRKKPFSLCAALMLVSSLLVALTATPRPVTSRASSVESLTMFRATKFDAHYRMPHQAEIERLLQKAGILRTDAAQAETEQAMQRFIQKWNERNPVTANPVKLRQLLNRERRGDLTDSVLTQEDTGVKSLVVPVEFPGQDTFDWCGDAVTTAGPLHNQIAPPGPRDNNTVWYEDTSPELYKELYFGVGPDAGVIVNHPNLDSVDLRGNTMANYYLEQSEGAFMPTGLVYPKWLQAAHSEGWYGADSCDGGNNNVRAQDLVAEAVELLKADDPTFPWQSFDGDGDGIVDNFTVIHAGVGQESGGGDQGSFAIWSHASLIEWPSGHLACEAPSAGCPDHNIYVREYSMDPENIDVGVISEEFGHAVFGLPDLYTNDYSNSVAFWSIMSGGAWNGPLGGMHPAPFPLWFRYLIGWSAPLELDYDTDPVVTIVGQHSLRPAWTEQGLKINLPDQAITVPNPLDTGQAWWSDVGDLVQNTLSREFDLGGTTAPIFSFSSYWSIEQDWDYGYVEVSDDGGATWTLLQDIDGVLTGTDPNGNNEGWGLTGEGSGTLRFDLSTYTGETILVRLRYATDLAVQWEGWWADDLALDDGATSLFFDDVEARAGDWQANGWRATPVTDIYPRYYLAEWRNSSGFDEGLQYAYNTVWYDDDEWEVDRAPYTVPGLLLWLRDTALSFDYALGDSLYDPPSWGSKHGLLVVDSHPFPYSWDEIQYGSGQNVILSGRVQSGNATFTLQDTTPFTLRRGFDETFQYVPEVQETKTFASQPAVSQFHDALGYYPGVWCCDGAGYLWFWDTDASAVLPATADYTTKITRPDNSPALEFYGIPLGNTVLGSGNPGDDAAQFGLHLAVIEQAPDGRWGAIAVWNSPALLDLDKKVNRAIARPGQLLRYTLKVQNLSPVLQPFVLHDPILEHTIFVGGRYYDPGSGSIHWEGTIAPGHTRRTSFWVLVKPGTPDGTTITNEAVLTDDALGDRASATTEVVEFWP